MKIKIDPGKENGKLISPSVEIETRSKTDFIEIRQHGKTILIHKSIVNHIVHALRTVAYGGR